MRIEQIAEMLGVEKAVAYGLLQYMRATGCVTTEKAEKAPGTRGKPAILYKLDQVSVEALSTLLKAKVPA